MKYSQEQIEFLLSYIPGHHHFETVNEFNKRFGANIKRNQIKDFAHNHHVKTGFKGSEGLGPGNKGKKVTYEHYMKSFKTMFKKGNKPASYRPVGSIRICQQGFKEIKIADPNKWTAYARYIYQKYIGPLDKNDRIIHLNGNMLDDEPENLIKVSMAELVRINQRKLITADKELTKAAVLQIRLEYLTRKKEKKDERDI